MKKIFSILTIAVCLLFAHSTAFSNSTDTDQITVTLQPEDDPDIPDLPVKGPRMPAPVSLCIIDFCSHSIEFSRVDVIINYELWDEEGTVILASYDNDYDMVMYLANLSGCYQLRLITQDCLYRGYIYN